MIPRRPRPPEGGPDEPGGEDWYGVGDPGAVEPAGPAPEGAEDTGLRGWVPPDARHWRHPSELHDGSGGAAGPGGWAAAPALGAGPVPARRRQNLATVLVASGAAAAVVAGVLLLAGTGSTPGPGDGSVAGPTPTLAEEIGCCRLVPAAVRAALEAMVSLEVTTEHGRIDVDGVAMAPGLVVTTLDALAGARSITAVTAYGRKTRAVLVAGDRDSDVALLKVAGRLSTAPFTERSSGTDDPALVLAVDAGTASRAGSSHDATMLWAGSTVRSVGDVITRGEASGMVGIEADAPSMPTVAGEVLVRPDGRVLGLLDRSASSPAVKVFLPAALVLGVARSLAAWGRVRHGWLGVVGENAGGVDTGGSSHRGHAVSTTTSAVRRAAGALVVKVEQDGPAAAVLRPGDVITSVDNDSLDSMAELRSLLYVMRPGERVRLEVLRGGEALSVALHLSASP